MGSRKPLTERCVFYKLGTPEAVARYDCPTCGQPIVARGDAAEVAPFGEVVRRHRLACEKAGRT